MKRQFMFLGAMTSLVVVGGSLYAALHSSLSGVSSALEASLIFAGDVATSLAQEASNPGSHGEEMGHRAVTVSRSEADFGLIPVGEKSDEVSFTVTNVGKAPITLRAIEPRTRAFLIMRAPILPARIGSGVRVPFTVVFWPATPGALSDSVEVVTDATPEPVHIQVRGHAVPKEGDAVVAKHPLAGDLPMTNRSMAGPTGAQRKMNVPERRLPAPRQVLSDVLPTVAQVPSWLGGGALMAEVPYVALTTLRRTENGVRCRWEMVNPTGRPISYSLFYETGGGRRVLVSGLREQVVDVDMGSLFPDGRGGKFVVQATDGVFTSEDSVAHETTGISSPDGGISFELKVKD